MAMMVASDIDGNQEYDLLVDAGVPGVGDSIGIEITKDQWTDFEVVQRTFNFGGSQTQVILRVRERTEPQFAVETT